ncbi:methylmalonyl-CoA mutase family protein [Lutibacter sp.]|uniref:methylmalonyl-CoA mutase family protein n=1 Tax=Lutibacter sp. TaxID=1925666 RepID=UPI003561D512
MKRKDFSKLSIKTQTEKNSYFEHEDFIAGTAPFLRGIDTTMFIQKNLTTQLLIDFSIPKKCNNFLKEHIFTGYKNCVFHFNTSTNPEALGIIANTKEDFKILLQEIPLNDIEITLSANEDIISILKLFFAAAHELGFDEKNLKISVVLNQKQQSTFIDDFLIYIDKNLSNFKSITILPSKTSKDYNPETELAYFLLECFSFITTLISKGFKIDEIAPKLALTIELGKNPVVEISKMRAVRILWSKMLLQFQPKNIKSSALKIHLNSNFSSHIKVLNAVFGGAQSVISSKAVFQIINEETNITRTVDPWAGSTSIEKKTEEIILNSWELFLQLQKK